MRADARVRAGYVALAAGGAALVMGLHRANPRFLVSAHGLLHAAIVERLRSGGLRLPPENPFFAGEPLPYYWAFHALAALGGGLLGLDPLRSLELWIVAAWVALVAACARAAPWLYGRAGLGLLAAWLALAGANVQAPLVALYRRIRVGPEVFHDHGNYLWGLAHPMLGTMRLWDGGALYGPLVNFFLNVTSRPVALGALAAGVALLPPVLARGRPVPTLALGLVVAFATAMSVVLGLPAALALAAGVGVATLRRRRAGHPPPWPGLAPALVALVGGAALGFLPAAHLDLGGAPVSAPGSALGKLAAMGAAAWPVALLALVGWHRASGVRRALLEALGWAALALAAGTIVLSLPEGNEVNLYHAALLLLALAAPAAFATGDPGRARRRAWIAALAFVPTFAMILACYLVRPPVPIAVRGDRLVRTDAPAAHAYAWIRSQAPEDAVIVTEPGPPPLAVSGNTSEVPALTGRDLFTERPRHYVVAPHPELEARVAAARALLAGGPVTPAQAAVLRAPGRPLLLLVDPRVPAPARSALALRHGPPLFAEGRWAVYAPALPVPDAAATDGGDDGEAG
ncbi:MAG: hypothetical protein R3263_04830 [Myxococcota bacterium]|nr:hypothetical protein [Myxococcota bacterium]